MNILPNSSSLPSTSVSYNDVTDALGSIPFDKTFDKIGSTLDDVTPELSDVTDFATTVAKSGGLIGLRTARRSYRVVRRHPRGFAGIIAGIIALTAVGIFLKKRNESPDLELANAA